MQFQNFRGSDVTEALSQVRNVLGPDAVIRATRRVKGGGPLDHGYVEIEAAPGEPSRRPTTIDASSNERVRRATFARVPERGERRQTPIPGSTRATVAPGSSRASLAPQPLTRGALPTSAPKQQAANDMSREIAELKAAVEALQATCTPRTRILGHLHAAGVEGTLATELSHGAPRSSKQTPGAWLRKTVSSKLRTTPSLIERPGQQLIACVGPTGAGKTTTLAKLAAKARLDLGRTVGVISLDTFRVGAVEQWQRYARLIGLPFFAARDENDFARALGQMDTDILLVDTEGQISGEGEPMRRLAAALAHTEAFEPHVLLTVPAWLRGTDVDRLVRSYPLPQPTAVVATKLDEATRSGGVLHACLPNQIPLAYVCTGPRVPEDIEDASAEALALRLFPREQLS
ncbi:MAG TPA: flagellar biosynthesis protein FlhF [Polyangiaceae bacterium]|nr:flagellar biosynthesis protein FlhF [Polyangiaceae bacterium]